MTKVVWPDGSSPCSIGSCSAEDGHDGTCAEASGWDIETDGLDDE